MSGVEPSTISDLQRTIDLKVDDSSDESLDGQTMLDKSNFSLSSTSSLDRLENFSFQNNDDKGTSPKVKDNISNKKRRNSGNDKPLAKRAKICRDGNDDARQIKKSVLKLLKRKSLELDNSNAAQGYGESEIMSGGDQMTGEAAEAPAAHSAKTSTRSSKSAAAGSKATVYSERKCGNGSQEISNRPEGTRPGTIKDQRSVSHGRIHRAPGARDSGEQAKLAVRRTAGEKGLRHSAERARAGSRDLPGRSSGPHEKLHHQVPRYRPVRDQSRPVRLHAEEARGGRLERRARQAHLGGGGRQEAGGAGQQHGTKDRVCQVPQRARVQLQLHVRDVHGARDDGRDSRHVRIQLQRGREGEPGEEGEGHDEAGQGEPAKGKEHAQHLRPAEQGLQEEDSQHQLQEKLQLQEELRFKEEQWLSEQAQERGPVSTIGEENCAGIKPNFDLNSCNKDNNPNMCLSINLSKDDGSAVDNEMANGCSGSAKCKNKTVSFCQRVQLAKICLVENKVVKCGSKSLKEDESTERLMTGVTMLSAVNTSQSDDLVDILANDLGKLVIDANDPDFPDFNNKMPKGVRKVKGVSCSDCGEILRDKAELKVHASSHGIGSPVLNPEKVGKFLPPAASTQKLELAVTSTSGESLMKESDVSDATAVAMSEMDETDFGQESDSQADMFATTLESQQLEPESQELAEAESEDDEQGSMQEDESDSSKVEETESSDDDDEQSPNLLLLEERKRQEEEEEQKKQELKRLLEAKKEEAVKRRRVKKAEALSNQFRLTSKVAQRSPKVSGKQPPATKTVSTKAKKPRSTLESLPAAATARTSAKVRVTVASPTSSTGTPLIKGKGKVVSGLAAIPGITETKRSKTETKIPSTVKTPRTSTNPPSTVKAQSIPKVKTIAASNPFTEAVARMARNDEEKLRKMREKRREDKEKWKSVQGGASFKPKKTTAGSNSKAKALSAAVTATAAASPGVRSAAVSSPVLSARVITHSPSFQLSTPVRNTRKFNSNLNMSEQAASASPIYNGEVNYQSEIEQSQRESGNLRSEPVLESLVPVVPQPGYPIAPSPRAAPIATTEESPELNMETGGEMDLSVMEGLENQVAELSRKLLSAQQLNGGLTSSVAEWEFKFNAAAQELNVAIQEIRGLKISLRERQELLRRCIPDVPIENQEEWLRGVNAQMSSLRTDNETLLKKASEQESLINQLMTNNKQTSTQLATMTDDRDGHARRAAALEKCIPCDVKGCNATICPRNHEITAVKNGAKKAWTNMGSAPCQFFWASLDGCIKDAECTFSHDKPADKSLLTKYNDEIDKLKVIMARKIVSGKTGKSSEKKKKGARASSRGRDETAEEEVVDVTPSRETLPPALNPQLLAGKPQVSLNDNLSKVNTNVVSMKGPPVAQPTMNFNHLHNEAGYPGSLYNPILPGLTGGMQHVPAAQHGVVGYNQGLNAGQVTGIGLLGAGGQISYADAAGGRLAGNNANPTAASVAGSPASKRKREMASGLEGSNAGKDCSLIDWRKVFWEILHDQIVGESMISGMLGNYTQGGAQGNAMGGPTMGATGPPTPTTLSTQARLRAMGRAYASDEFQRDLAQLSPARAPRVAAAPPQQQATGGGQAPWERIAEQMNAFQEQQRLAMLQQRADMERQQQQQRAEMERQIEATVQQRLLQQQRPQQ